MKLTEYSWWGNENEPPENLKTKNQLGEIGLKPVNPVGIIYCKKYDVKLYDINNSESVRPKQQMNEARKKSLEKARYISGLVAELRRWSKMDFFFSDRQYNDAVFTSRQIVENPSNYVILDSETTGLDDDAEIVEISIIDINGATLLDTLVKPQCEINLEAQAIHGISAAKLENQPTFDKIYPKIQEAILGKTICIYNKQFDIGKLKHCCKLYKLPWFCYEKPSICIMETYAKYYQDWSEYWDNWKWQPLNGGHRALGDCQAILELIKEMAESNLHSPPKEYFELVKTGTASKKAKLYINMVKENYPYYKF